MKLLFWIAVGGAVGAIARYGVLLLSHRYLGEAFPFGTLIVNVAGSFLMGVFVELIAVAWPIPAEWRALVTVGALGAFTTFSTFSLDFALLYERGRLDLAAAYTAVSVGLSVGALFAGLHAVRRLVA